MTDDKGSEMYDLCIVNKQIRNQHVRNLSVIEKKNLPAGKELSNHKHQNKKQSYIYHWVKICH